MGSLGVGSMTDGSFVNNFSEKVTPPPSSAGDCQDDSFGYDFEDSQTRAQLELVDDLQKLGVSKYLDLPQVCFPAFLMGLTNLEFSVSGCWRSKHR